MLGLACWVSGAVQAQDMQGFDPAWRPQIGTHSLTTEYLRGLTQRLLKKAGKVDSPSDLGASAICAKRPSRIAGQSGHIRRALEQALAKARL